MALPFALGDRLALLAAYLRPLSALGFGPLVGTWTVVTALVAFPAAVVAGYQFPLLIVAIGCAVAIPVGVATGIFLHEIGRPAALARLVDTSIDIIFGIPSIVLALFGVAVFTEPALIPLSQEVGSSGKASGTSFLCAGLVISLIAVPPVVRGTQSALAFVPRIRREASYALGKTRAATLRRIVLPEARPGIATGVVLGIGRIVGDTAVIWLLLGGNVLNPPDRGWLAPASLADTLRGQGTTLTSYIFYAAPTGEGNAEQKAYGAALVLMALMVLVNAVVLVVGRTGTGIIEITGAHHHRYFPDTTPPGPLPC